MSTYITGAMALVVVCHLVGCGGEPAGSTDGSAGSSASSGATGQKPFPKCICTPRPSTGWEVDGYRATSVTSGAILDIDVDLTDGEPLTDLFAMFTPPTGHSALPAMQPSFALFCDSKPPSVSLATADRDAVTVAEYEIAPSAIRLRLPSMPVQNDGLRYAATFIGERGPWSLPGLKFDTCACYYAY